jgi:GntR family transcriptional activator of glc operon
VIVRRGSGTTVTGTSVDAYATAVATMLIQSELTLGQVFEARAALEGQLALIAARNHTAGQARRMRAALEEFAAAVEERDRQAIVRTHVELHTEIVRATNLPALSILLRPIQQMMAATSVVGRDVDPTDPRAWRVKVHRSLVDAIAARDAGAVASANAAHWSAATRGDGYREIRGLRVAEMFPSPRDLLRHLEAGGLA